MIFIVFCAFWVVFAMCLLKVSLGSKVRPRIVGCLVVGSNMLFIVRLRALLYSAGSGVKSVVMVLSALSIRSLSIVHVYMSSR